MMKLIIAATDFSKTARNAISYAAEIAKRANARLVLLHVYYPTVIMAEAPVVLPLPGDIENGCMRQLKRIRYQLLTRHGRRFNVELACVQGVAADAICSYAHEHNADLVVAGTHGAGYLEEKLIGSVTSELIASCECPVLSIATGTRFKSIKKIALAADCRELSHKTLLDPLKEIADMFRPHIFVLNVVSNEQHLPTLSEAAEGVKLEQTLNNYDHSFHAVINEDVVTGINTFVTARHIDMVVMIPRHHSFFKTLFGEHHSKTMSFHTATPLLTIHN